MQSLSNHSLAHVKQDFPPARFSFRANALLMAAIFSILLPGSACVTLPRNEPSVAEASMPAAKSHNKALININSATADELEVLPGIGKVTAERIVAHRTKHGPFRRAEHLMLVDGISERRFHELLNLITTE